MFLHDYDNDIVYHDDNASADDDTKMTMMMTMMMTMIKMVSDYCGEDDNETESRNKIN